MADEAELLLIIEKKIVALREGKAWLATAGDLEHMSREGLRYLLEFEHAAEVLAESDDDEDQEAAALWQGLEHELKLLYVSRRLERLIAQGEFWAKGGRHE